MSDELLTLSELAELYRCDRRHKDLSLLSNVYYRATADSITKLI